MSGLVEDELVVAEESVSDYLYMVSGILSQIEDLDKLIAKLDRFDNKPYSYGGLLRPFYDAISRQQMELRYEIEVCSTRLTTLLNKS